MHTFLDYYKREVQLSFEDHPFSANPMHVWVICRYRNQWLLTNHKKRGLEFPGGKVEKSEKAEQAACREVLEETGADISSLRYIGQYQIPTEQICKNIYYAEIHTLETKEDYLETDGPVCVSHFPKNLRQDEHYSFIMKDHVLTHCLSYIDTQGLI
ncbi:RNA deprotection pyrophosphohydrolase [Alkalicoccobacillus porphyridii]|uniref:Nucleoside triphosphatase YtkD n=1 Tax=Alkalicoccobacillus porphyridii TaxID=2597270 RepID=A0A554A373_9BACI|nr:nucleoside triphosphatase YtkD [Alkalicoccobacillus porphyridii]TSB48137.1 nucleoside triphosphatase YtkD [Alkalicoccobacillus porphyridii]